MAAQLWLAANFSKILKEDTGWQTEAKLKPLLSISETSAKHACQLARKLTGQTEM